MYNAGNNLIVLTVKRTPLPFALFLVEVRVSE